MPIFTLPFMLLGLAALPGVAVIYMLRTRSRRQVVSSLMLWSDQRHARAGGLKFQRIQTPLLLIIELIIVTLLVLAASGPKIPTQRNRRPLVIVLDNSFSMQAGGKDSPQSLARQAIQTELETGKHHPVQFILASDRPVAMGRPARTIQLAQTVMEAWGCKARIADLQAAMTLATTLAASNESEGKARILVVTDQPPRNDPGPGDVKWLAFGQPRANIAFTAAVRSQREGRQQCLIELSNFAAETQTASLTINGLGETRKHNVAIPGGATDTLRLNVPDATSIIRAELGDDDLQADNSLTLLPQPQRIVRVDLNIANKPIRDALTRAITVSRRAIITDKRATLQITDQPGPPPGDRQTWLVQFISEIEANADAYTGPFVIDRTHPLTDGLSLAGQIWGAGKTAAPHGRTIISAGNAPLITERLRPGGRREIRIRLCPEISTLQDSANWPVLISNLLDYRSAALPGMEQSNVPLGLQARVALKQAVKTVTVIDPSGTTSKTPVVDQVALITAQHPGVYTVSDGTEKYQFATNTIAPAESDLSDAVAGSWGDWLGDRAISVEYVSIVWPLLLAAIIMLAAHAAIVSTRSKGAGS